MEFARCYSKCWKLISINFVVSKYLFLFLMCAHLVSISYLIFSLSYAPCCVCSIFLKLRKNCQIWVCHIVKMAYNKKLLKFETWIYWFLKAGMNSLIKHYVLMFEYVCIFRNEYMWFSNLRKFFFKSILTMRYTQISLLFAQFWKSQF